MRAHGLPEAHPCRLDEAADITHALAVLEVRLLAQRAGLAVLTEKRLPPGDATPYLRPDNLVTLPAGTRALLETEQVLTAQHIARAIESLQNKLRFFKSAAGKDVSSDVRVVFNLPKGKDYDRTLRVWNQAAQVVAQRHGGRLPFRLLAMPLSDFQAAPDWSAPPSPHRWTVVSEAAREREDDLGIQQVAATRSAASNQQLATSPRLPQELHRYSGRESGLVLRALWLAYQEGALRLPGPAAQPDPALFEIAGIVHTAARGAHLSPLERAGFPHAALFLLRHYLRLHPTLLKTLQREIPRGAQAIRWNTVTITHRMQVVCGKFLAYHGFADNGALLVRALSADWNASEPQHFQVRVNIHEPEVLLLGDGLVPDRAWVQSAAAALAWLLTALFIYAEELGLPRPPFW